LEIADCPLDGCTADSLSIKELTEHRRGQRELVAKQMVELLDLVQVFGRAKSAHESSIRDMAPCISFSSPTMTPLKNLLQLPVETWMVALRIRLVADS